MGAEGDVFADQERLLFVSGKAGFDETTFGRLVKLALCLGAGLPVDTAYIRARFGVSKATAKRDMMRLQSFLALDVHEDATGRRTLKSDNGIRVTA